MLLGLDFPSANEQPQETSECAKTTAEMIFKSTGCSKENFNSDIFITLIHRVFLFLWVQCICKFCLDEPNTMRKAKYQRGIGQ